MNQSCPRSLQGVALSLPGRALCLLCCLLLLGAGFPGRAQCDSFRFVAMGDSRGNDAANFFNASVLGSANQSVAALNPAPSFVIFLGDNSIMGDLDTKGSNQFTYQNWFNFMRSPTTGIPSDIPLYLVTGNHELYQASLGNQVQSYVSQTGWQAFMNQGKLLTPNTFMPGTTSLPGYDNLAYSFTSPDKSSLFVVLDGFYVPSPPDIPYYDPGRLDSNQLNFLNYTLSTSTASSKFVISHNPAFLATSPDYDTAVDPSMAQMWQIMDNNNVTAFLSGHVHMYSRTMVGPSFTSGPSNPNPGLDFKRTIPQIVAGSVGAPPIGSVTNEPTTIYAPASWNWKNLYNYSVITVDNVGPAAKVEVETYCSNGGSDWLLCDKFAISANTAPDAVRLNAVAASTANSGSNTLASSLAAGLPMIAMVPTGTSLVPGVTPPGSTMPVYLWNPADAKNDVNFSATDEVLLAAASGATPGKIASLYSAPLAESLAAANARLSPNPLLIPLLDWVQ